MRTFGTFLAVGILALAVGCGSSDNTTSTTTNTTTNTAATTNTVTSTLTNTATSTLTNTATSTLTNTATNTTTATGNCNYPSCLASLLTSCIPTGTCVEQTDLTTFATNTCYSNGVKSITSMNATTGEIVMTIKNGSSTCYSMNVATAASGSSYALTIKNGSGQTIATGTGDLTTGGMTVTCTGGQPVTIDASCDPTGSTSSSDTCTTGTCTGDSSASTATVTATNTTTTTTTTTTTGTNCAALTACCPALAAAQGITAKQCQDAFAGLTDATCASTLTPLKSAGLCQ